LVDDQEAGHKASRRASFAELRRLLRAPESFPADELIAASGRWLGIIGADGQTEHDVAPVSKAEQSAGVPQVEAGKSVV
jgi:hypothetical protein